MFASFSFSSQEATTKSPRMKSPIFFMLCKFFMVKILEPLQIEIKFETERYTPRHYVLPLNPLPKLGSGVALCSTSSPECTLWIYTNVCFGPKHDISGINREGSISKHAEVGDSIAYGEFSELNKRSIESDLFVEAPRISVGNRIFVGFWSSQMLDIHIVAKIVRGISAFYLYHPGHKSAVMTVSINREAPGFLGMPTDTGEITCSWDDVFFRIRLQQSHQLIR